MNHAIERAEEEEQEQQWEIVKGKKVRVSYLPFTNKRMLMKNP
jgi:acyl-coenzyme A synthetase/AMP-(fatty) acid ligase